MNGGVGAWRRLWLFVPVCGQACFGGRINPGMPSTPLSAASNKIGAIEGVSQLTGLTLLELGSNRIRTIEVIMPLLLALVAAADASRLLLKLGRKYIGAIDASRPVLMVSPAAAAVPAAANTVATAQSLEWLFPAAGP